jgi:formylglycine-generating enzyme required for sulfatase activity
VDGTATVLHDAEAARRAGADGLSLALIDARNALLQFLARDESAAALRIGARAGAWAEHWINRHVQRGRGEACDPTAPRLGPRECAFDLGEADPADGSAAAVDPAETSAAGLPRVPTQAREPGDAQPAADAQALRAALARSLETTLDLLAAAQGGAAARLPGEAAQALHFFRLALRHEDRCVEQLAWLAAQRGEALVLAAGGPGAPGVGAAPPARPGRPPLALPGQRWMLGSARGPALVPEAERWAHEVVLPPFEIDALPVNWAQMAEFAGDGGYDRAELWTAEGWAWVQAEGRRGPRGLAHWAGGVVLERGGRLQRVHPQQPVLGATRHEAQAWCRWAGRRLPTEPEWEAAACGAGSRGFVWGDVLEWVAGSGRPYPGHAPVPGEIDPVPIPVPGAPRASGAPGAPGAGAVLRGAAWLTPRRGHHPRGRRFAAPQDDTLPTGFRSCAL